MSYLADMSSTRRRLLLLSASRAGSTGYLEHALPLIQQFLAADAQKKSALTIAFVAYAGVSLPSFDAYGDRVQSALAPILRPGDKLVGVHNGNPVDNINSADVIMIGGGSTWNLLNELYKTGILETIRARVQQGIPYIGWSAGSNVAGATIKTTNDMPIVEPPSFTALALVPLQINPHFISGKPPGHNGESREERLAEFLVANPGVKVVAIREGTGLQVGGDTVTLIGADGLDGLLFQNGHAPLRIPVGSSHSVVELV